jgi:hypothetical protein
MNVHYIHEQLKEIRFEDAALGLCFIFEEEAWLKIPLVAEEASDESAWYNAIHLETGEPQYIPGVEIIIVPKSSVLKIEY